LEAGFVSGRKLWDPWSTTALREFWVCLGLTSLDDVGIFAFSEIFEKLQFAKLRLRQQHGQRSLHTSETNFKNENPSRWAPIEMLEIALIKKMCKVEI
jgi:hypothetical protein